MSDALRPASRLAHGGGVPISETGGDPVVPAWQPTTTFVRDGAYALPPGQSSYIRGLQPGGVPAERLLAELEGGAACALFASGTAAAAAIVCALSPGARIVAPSVMYWGFRGWMIEHAKRHGLRLDFFDAAVDGDLARVLAAASTQLLWLETPTNPTWDVIDLDAACAAGRAAGAEVVVDSTVATPLLTRPIAHGADLVMHSATKYLNGHSDVIAGAVVAAEGSRLWEAVVKNRTEMGAVLGSFEAWLLLRGLRTLHLRVERACASALAIAQHFEGAAGVREVRYPGLPGFAGHAIAARQMQGGFGGMLSICVEGGFEAAQRVATRCRVFLPATSLGGVESLIEHRAAIEGPDSPIPSDLLRISVGIEAVEDLVADLSQAIGAST